MKKLSLLTFVFAMVGVFMLTQPVKVNADDGKPHDESGSHKTAESYSYTAQTDDSYTVLARKAIQTFGLENKVNLSGAQIVFAETSLTLEAKSPVLNTGQKVEFQKDIVKSWVEKAQKLTDVQKKNWNYYVQFVDFDTRDNGEVKKS